MFNSPSLQNEEGLSKSYLRLLLVFLIAVLIAIFGSGYQYYVDRQQAARQHAREHIKAIGDLKANELANWLKERKGDAETIFDSPVSVPLKGFLADPAASTVRQETLRWLASLIRNYGYSAVILFDAKGNVILSSPIADVTLETLGSKTRGFIEQALANRKVVFSDLYQGDKSRLDFVVPLLSEQRSRELIGALLLRVNPQDFLFPLIQDWPTPSPTGETLLVRQEDNEIVYLNALRHRDDTPMSLRLPLSLSPRNIVASLPNEGQEVDGIDYRGERVLAAIRPIPDSPWHIIAKVDREEIEAPIRSSAIRTGMIVLLLMLVASLSIWLVWRRQTEALVRKSKCNLEMKIQRRTAELEEEVSHRRQTEEQQRQLLAQLEQQKETLNTVLFASSDCVFMHDREGRYLYANPAGLRGAGQTAEEMIGKTWRELGFPAEIMTLFDADLESVFTTGNPVSNQFRHPTPYGLRDIDSLLSPVRDESGRITKVVSSLRDVTDRKQAEQFRQRLATILEATPDFVGFADPQGRMLYINEAGCRMIGIAQEDVTHKNIAELSPHWAAELISSEGVPQAIDRGSWQGKTALLHRDGYEVPVSQVILAHKTPDGEVNFLSTIARDITEQKNHELQLQYQANHDSLTQLPNLNLLQDRLNHAIAHARRNNRWVAVMFLNLDRFRNINDSLGHAVGDALLKVVATRLKENMRAGDTVARLGGDEFVIVLEDLPQGEIVGTVAGKVLEAMEAPFRVEGYEFFVTCRIGISLFPRDGEDVQVLLKSADAALHNLKGQGHGRIQFFTAEMNDRALERLNLEIALRHALERGELELYYQPQVDVRSGRIFGVEALLRWQHPQLGLVSPAKFIALAEETGLIVAIGEWVLNTACAQARAWQEAGLPSLQMAVNLSTRQFMQPDLAGLIARVLEETGLESCYLELEITESLLMGDVERAVNTLHALKGLGVQLAIDDFGTGYSSLNYLKRFPIDRLKIDKSFVQDITTNPQDAAITLAIIAMARSMRLEVIAEGVETEVQLAFLQSRNCHEMQGYYFSPPLSVTEMTALQEEKRIHTWMRAETARHAPRTLLLVDDDVNITAALSRILYREGYRILTAHSAPQALELLACHQIGVVIADQLMPGMNGTELLKRVRELYPETVRIMLSGHGNVCSLVEAINQGAIYKFLSKPVIEDILRATLREAFSLYEIQRRHPASDLLLTGIA